MESKFSDELKEFDEEFKHYEGELTNIDPIKYGEMLFTTGKTLCNETDPTFRFFANSEEDEAFLEDFYGKIERGYAKAKRQNEEIEYQKALTEFQKSVPAVGTRVWVEYPGSPGRYFEGDVVYLPDDRSAAVVKFADEKRHGLGIVEYAYPGAYPTIHSEKPLDKIQ